MKTIRLIITCVLGLAAVVAVSVLHLEPAQNSAEAQFLPDGMNTIATWARGGLPPYWQDAGSGSIASQTAAPMTVDATAKIAVAGITSSGPVYEDGGLAVGFNGIKLYDSNANVGLAGTLQGQANITAIVCSGCNFQSNSEGFSGGSNPGKLKTTNGSNSSTTVQTILDGDTALTTDGSKITSFRTGTVEKAFVDRNGGIRPGLASGTIPVCNASSEGTMVAKPGTGGVPTKFCICRYDGTSTYAWWGTQIIAAPSFTAGTTTTCP